MLKLYNCASNVQVIFMQLLSRFLTIFVNFFSLSARQYFHLWHLFLYSSRMLATPLSLPLSTFARSNSDSFFPTVDWFAMNILYSGTEWHYTKKRKNFKQTYVCLPYFNTENCGADKILNYKYPSTCELSELKYSY